MRLQQVIVGMRGVKLNGWALPFERKVTELRAKEMKFVHAELQMFAFQIFLMIMNPQFAILATFSCKALTAERMGAADAFAAMALFNVLRFPLMYLGQVIALGVQALVSTKRITSYLAKTNVTVLPGSGAVEIIVAEMSEVETEDGEESEADLLFAFQHATFSWSIAENDRGDDDDSNDKTVDSAATTTPADSGFIGAASRTEDVGDSSATSAVAKRPIPSIELTPSRFTSALDQLELHDVASLSAAAKPGTVTGGSAAGNELSTSQFTSALEQLELHAAASVLSRADTAHAAGAAAVPLFTGGIVPVQIHLPLPSPGADGTAEAEGEDDESPSTTPRSFVLSQVSLRLNRGEVVAVVGGVGSGKSTLLSSILRETVLVGGAVTRRSRSVAAVAYAAQTAWVMNDTLRSNIIFGEAFEKEWFDEVLEACGMVPDIATLANGIETVIGERGVTLSGGQKQRVSLARAVYARADLVLLDDPLSALDAHTGSHVFRRLLGKRGLLRRELPSGRRAGVVLVTHAAHFLGSVDRVIVLHGGEIKFAGDYAGLSKLVNDAVVAQGIEIGDGHARTSKGRTATAVTATAPEMVDNGSTEQTLAAVLRSLVVAQEGGEDVGGSLRSNLSSTNSLGSIAAPHVTGPRARGSSSFFSHTKASSLYLEEAVSGSSSPRGNGRGSPTLGFAVSTAASCAATERLGSGSSLILLAAASVPATRSLSAKDIQELEASFDRRSGGPSLRRGYHSHMNLEVLAKDPTFLAIAAERAAHDAKFPLEQSQHFHEATGGPSLRRGYHSHPNLQQFSSVSVPITESTVTMLRRSASTAGSMDNLSGSVLDNIPAHSSAAGGSGSVAKKSLLEAAVELPDVQASRKIAKEEVAPLASASQSYPSQSVRVDVAEGGGGDDSEIGEKSTPGGDDSSSNSGGSDASLSNRALSKEHRDTGGVSFGVYFSFFKAAGGLMWMVPLLVVITLERMLYASCDWWYVLTTRNPSGATWNS